MEGFRFLTVEELARGVKPMPHQRRTERIGQDIIVVHDCTVDYDMAPSSEELDGLLGDLDYLNNINPACWNGGRSGKRVGVDVPIFFPKRAFRCSEGRRGLTEHGYEYGVPADLVPLWDVRVRRELADLGVGLVAALDRNHRSLWLPSSGEASEEFMSQLGPGVGRHIVMLELWEHGLLIEEFPSDHRLDSNDAAVGASLGC